MIFLFAWPFGRGFGFGGGAPSPPPPPPPPPKIEDPDIAKAGVNARIAARKRRGRASTLLAGESSDSGFTAPDDTLSGKSTLG